MAYRSSNTVMELQGSRPGTSRRFQSDGRRGRSPNRSAVVGLVLRRLVVAAVVVLVAATACSVGEESPEGGDDSGREPVSEALTASRTEESSDRGGSLSDEASGEREFAGRFAAISLKYGRGCGLGIDGSMTCWESGRRVLERSGEFTAVSAGADHACALRADGTISCWSWLRTPRDEPPDVLHVTDGQFTAVSAGAFETCALRADGTVLCWWDIDLSGEVEAPGDGSRQLAAAIFIRVAFESAVRSSAGARTGSDRPPRRRGGSPRSMPVSCTCAG